MNCIVALSGGADSTTLLKFLLEEGYQTTALFFDYQQRHIRELAAAESVAHHYRTPLKIISLFPPQVGALAGSDPTPAHEEVVGHPQPPTYVPMRNLLISAYLSSYAEAHEASIALGVHRSDTYGYWDTTPEFILRLQSILLLSRGHQIRVLAPFQRWTKTDIIKWGFEHDVPYHWTWSCYAGEELACGKCSTCVERIASFTQLGLRDPIRYAFDEG